MVQSDSGANHSISRAVHARAGGPEFGSELLTSDSEQLRQLRAVQGTSSFRIRLRLRGGLSPLPHPFPSIFRVGQVWVELSGPDRTGRAKRASTRGTRGNGEKGFGSYARGWRGVPGRDFPLLGSCMHLAISSRARPKVVPQNERSGFVNGMRAWIMAWR